MPMSDEDHEHIVNLLQTHRKRLRLLELQQARLGIATPPEIRIEIDTIVDEVKGLMQQLAAAGIRMDLLDGKFVNQSVALQTVLEDQRHADYFLVDAPVGCGKSLLLARLAKELPEHGWRPLLFAFGDLDHGLTAGLERSSLVEERAVSHIAQHFGAEPDKDAEEIGRMVTVKLYAQLDKDQAADDFEGWALIIDDLEFVNLEALSPISNKLKLFFKGLRDGNHEIFNDRYRIRIVLAGSYISPYVSALLEESTYVPLHALDFNAVEAFTNNILSRRISSEIKRNFARYALYMTGGHPELLRRILIDKSAGVTEHIYSDLATWVPSISRDIQTRLRGPLIEKIKHPLDAQLWDLLEALSVFRRFTDDIVLMLMRDRQVGRFTKEPFEVVEELQKYRLVRRIERTVFYEDVLLRPTIVCWLQFSSDDRLSLCIAKAQAYFRGLLKRKNEAYSLDFILNELFYLLLLQRYRLALESDMGARRQSFDAFQSALQNDIQAAKQRTAKGHSFQTTARNFVRMLEGDKETTALFEYIFPAKAGIPTYRNFVNEVGKAL